MSARLADERGFTLVELLAAISVSTVVLFALFGLVDTATRQQSVATDRIDANDRGRLAMDAISTQLRSRVCISSAEDSLVAASDSQIEFFVSLGLTPEGATNSQTLVLQRRRLTYRPATSDVLEESWVGILPAPALPPAASTTPTRTRTLLTNVSLDGSTPFFRYYAMTSPAPPDPPLPELLLAPTPLSATNLTKVAQITVSFAAKGKVAGLSTPLQNRILDRSPGCYFG
jgi:prepilin-type N-terminal cleavage/methylation domain-containing protein